MENLKSLSVLYHRTTLNYFPPMTLLNLITYTGIFVFAATGAFKARTYQMDIFGASVLAFVTAYGGGTLRDLLIGVRPVNWVNDYLALGLVFSATLITFIFKLNYDRFKRTIFITDAIGLGLFTAAGIEKSILLGVNEMYAVVMGVITATFGGMLGDVLCNAVPNLFKRGELYATACAIGGVVYVLLRKAGFEQNTNLILCVVIVVLTRIISKWKRVELPEI
jgi:uncharacterized membrane protein YeiH